MLGYIRFLDVDGDMLWVLFGDEGDPLVMSQARYSVCSYAYNHHITIHTLH